MTSKADVAPKTSGKLKPTVFGRYLLLDRVASGGMAEVWRAKVFGADDFQRIIAIKKILPHVVEDPEFIQMFKDEAKITVLLDHANIGRILELDKVDDTFYIAMEYISGKDAKTIWSYQRQKGTPLPIPVACMIVQKMCEGLDYAHRKRDNFGTELKIVHRDVSPQNVLISWEGEVKVIDFGIAKAAGKASKTQAGILKGKFGYMAPEQVRGMPIDQRADVFALGVCLYEYLTGERAFLADSDFSLLEMVRNVEIKPPSLANNKIPQDLEAIIYKAMAKDPDDRYQWASDLSEDLQRFMLMAGRPPSRNDMSEYLRANFSSDYDKERIRMESYRDLEMPELPAPKAAAQAAPPPPPPPPPSASAMAVQNALMEDSSPPTGRNSSAPKPHPGAVRAAGGTDPRRANPAGGATAIRAAAEPTPQAVAPPPVRNKNTKLFAISAGVFVGVLGLAGVVGLALRGTGTISISTQPDGAEVFLDGETRGVTAGDLVIKSVSTGPHLLKVVKPHYVPFSVSVQVGRSSIYTDTIKLERMPDPTSLVTVRSSPAGGVIWVDGVTTEKTTPTDLEMTVGSHNVEVRLKNYGKQERKLTVETDKRHDLDFRLKPELVNLRIVTVPDKAKVADKSGTQLGTTPFVFENVSVNPPYPELVFKHPKCPPYGTTVLPDETSQETEQTKTITIPKCKP